MQTKDIYGKTLSNTFESAITNVSQYIKPRAVFDLQDGRHLNNVSAYNIGDGLSYVTLNATSSSLCWSLDRNELDIVGDIDISARVKLVDWTPGYNMSVMSKWFLGIQSWIFLVNTNGSLGLWTTTNGSTSIIQNSSVGPFVNNETYWIRVTLDVVNGANRVYTFYWAYDSEFEPTTWKVLSTHTVAGTTSIYSGTARLEIGCQSAGFNLLNGSVYRGIVRNGINGSVVADFNPNDAELSSNTSWYSSSPTGELWNRGANASLSVNHYSSIGSSVETGGYLNVGGYTAYSLDRPEFDVTTELQMVARVSSPYWVSDTRTTNNENYPFIAKWNPNVLDDASYVFYNSSTNDLAVKIYTSAGGASITGYVNLSPLNNAGNFEFVNDRTYWVRAVVKTNHTVSVGVLGVKFDFYAAYDQETEPTDTEWVYLGTSIYQPAGWAGAAIVNSTTPLTIGGSMDWAGPPAGTGDMVGKVYYASVKSGISSPTVVAKFDPSDVKNPTDTYWISSSPTGEPWNLTYSGALVVQTSSNNNLDYYFNPDNLINGVEYETFAWGVCGGIDSKGQVINASGKYVALPQTLEDNLKYGWWGSKTSDSNKSVPIDRCGVVIHFDPTVVNKIKVVTTQLYGPVEVFNLRVYSQSLGIIHNANHTFNIKDDEFEKIINLSSTYEDINLIVIRAVSTYYPNDYPKFVSVSPIYRVDLSEYIISSNVSRIRDLHETSLPIAGTSQTSASISLDNTGKLFSPIGNTSLYGKYLVKDVKVHLSQGWKTQPNSPDTVRTFLTSNMAASAEIYINVNNSTDFPDGDVSNTLSESRYYIVTIDPSNQYEEKILVKKKISNLQLEIAQRGYAGTTAVAHTANAVVEFDPFEYVSLGNFYIEEISTSSSDMVTSITLQDHLKFLNDKTTDSGFFRQDVTVPDAVSDLLMLGNFPRKDIITLNRYSDTPRLNDGILQFKCEDISRNSNGSNVAQGLRFRVYFPELDSIYQLTDFKLDSFERELTDLEKAIGISSGVDPQFTTTKPNINLVEYDVTTEYPGQDSRNRYYQAVFDGYLVPTTTNPTQTIGIGLADAAARVYINDILVIDYWNFLNFGWDTLFYGWWKYATISTVAGVPMKLRVEFIKGSVTEKLTGGVLVPSGVSVRLSYGPNANPLLEPDPIPQSHFLTNVLTDSIGSKGVKSNTTLISDLYNHGIPTTYVNFQKPSGMAWSLSESSIQISNTDTNGNVLSYIRIPYDFSMDPSYANIYSYGDWSAEIVFKAPNGPYGGQGEYISSYSNANSTVGFEFFYISSTNHGIRVRPAGNAAAANIVVTSSTAMPNGGNSWNHVIATYSSYDNKIYYYVNGDLHASQSCNGQTPSFTGRSITIGGRGSDYTSGVGPVLPTSTISNSGINLDLDEFTIYKKHIHQDEAKRRYIETQIKEVKKYPFLYAFKDSIYQGILNISFADLGRLYIDENGKAIYEGYYAFFEPSIDQHANIQQTLSDSQYLINASLTKSLQVNSVVVKISGISSKNNSFQSIWRAPDNTTLGVVQLTDTVDFNSNYIPVSSFTAVPFPKSGYVIIDSEIIKYLNSNTSAFLSLERGQFGTAKSIHATGSKVREVRVYDFEFDKTPAFAIKNPFITGILFEEPNEIQILNWKYSPYKGNLIVAATDNVASNSVVFLEGVNPVTQEVAYTSIAGIPVQVIENNGQVKEQKSVNSENRRKYGLKEVVIESPFITDAVFAQELADFIISKLAEPVPIISVETVLTPKLQVGDKIRLSSLDQFNISNVDYWITSIELGIGSDYSQSLELRRVV